MRIFEIVKGNVNLREAAERYGIDVNRYGKALCPFHNDRHPSLYVADDHYYRVSSELAQNERLYNVEATNNVHVGGKRVRGFVGIEVVNPLPY